MVLDVQACLSRSEGLPSYASAYLWEMGAWTCGFEGQLWCFVVWFALQFKGAVNCWVLSALPEGMVVKCMTKPHIHAPW